MDIKLTMEQYHKAVDIFSRGNPEYYAAPSRKISSNLMRGTAPRSRRYLLCYQKSLMKSKYLINTIIISPINFLDLA